MLDDMLTKLDELMKDYPPDWAYRVGYTVKDGVLCEVLVSASDMGKGGGDIYYKAIPDEVLCRLSSSG